MAKKAICLIFAFLLSINSFAAIVSDNDGSAFITKGEFDAMKKGFADQIDNYNNSIEGKIDGAIAAYLAGLIKNVDPDIIYDDVVRESGGNIRFYNDFTITGQQNIGSELRSSTTRKWNYKSKEKLVNWFVIIISKSSSGGAWYDFVPTKGQSYGTFPFDVYRDNNRQYGVIWRDTLRGDAYGTGYYQSGDSWTAFPTQGTQTQPNSYNYQNNAVTLNGPDYSKGFWLYRKGVGDTKYLLSCHTEGRIRQEYQLTYQTYADRSSVTTVDNNSYADTTARSLKVDQQTVLGGRKIGEDSISDTDNNKYQGMEIISLVKDTIDDYNYGIAQWGANANGEIWCLDDEPEIKKGTVKYDSGYVNMPSFSFNAGEKSHSVSEVSVEMYPMYTEATKIKASDFECKYLTSTAGEKVYVGGGVPIFYGGNGTNTYEVYLEFIVYQGITKMSSDSSIIDVKISNKQFKECEFDNSASLKESGIATYNPNTGSYTIKLTASEITSERPIFVNAAVRQGGYVAELVDVKVKA